MSLGKANVKLAHRPWEFSEKDVKDLLIQWNSNELVLALTELCQFHCLSGFVFGVGVAPEPDLPLVNHKEPPSPIVKPTKSKTNIVAILKGQTDHSETEDYISDSSEDLHGYEEDIYFSRIAGDSLCYINYPMDCISRPFNASEFRFADQAYFILEKMAPEFSESIWNRIRTALAMTYDYVGQDSGVETGPLRRAIWNYVQRVYGLQYDDYNYTDINRFLKINTKKYIKKIACFPETVTKQDWVNIEIDLTYDEMIHLNLIICEARFEAQLVYMLHAVQRALDLG
jgi:sestrin